MYKVPPLPDSARKYIDENPDEGTPTGEAFEVESSSQCQFSYADFKKGPEICSSERAFAGFCVLCALWNVVGRLGLNGFGFPQSQHSGIISCVTSMPFLHCCFLILLVVALVNIPAGTNDDTIQTVVVFLVVPLLLYPFYMANVARGVLLERYGISTDGHDCEEFSAMIDIRQSVARMYWFLEKHPLPQGRAVFSPLATADSVV